MCEIAKATLNFTNIASNSISAQIVAQYGCIGIGEKFEQGRSKTQVEHGWTVGEPPNSL